MGSINSVLDQISTIAILKNAKEEEVEMWLVRLDRIYKQNVFGNDYFSHVTRFFKGNWEYDLDSIRRSSFFKLLKPQLQSTVFQQE